MPNGFTDYEMFIRDLLRAINDEAEAIDFYRVLYDMTTNRLHRDYIKDVRNDEKRHFNLLSRLFRKLTGTDPIVELLERCHHSSCSSSSSSSCHHKHHHHGKHHHDNFSFVEGIQRAFDDEQEAYNLYRDLILMTSIPAVRDILLVPLTDENEHAQKFNWIFTDLIRSECDKHHHTHSSDHKDHGSKHKHKSGHKHHGDKKHHGKHKHHGHKKDHKHHKHHKH